LPTFYRVVRRDPPHMQDFTSNRDKGLPPRGPEVDDRSLWEGISVYDSRDRAERQALRYSLGDYIAVLHVDDSERGGVTFKKTLADLHHFTVWGEPAVLVARVQEVLPVRR
jgi:hypothetical protein